MVSNAEERLKPTTYAGLAGGLVLFAVLILSGAPRGLSAEGWAVLCVAALMTVFWLTEALPVSLTATLPFLLLPLLGVRSSGEVASSYFSPVLFLVLGGFLLALSMEKWGLHRRVALLALSGAGGSARSVLLAIMAATALVSMFVSNSAAMLAMLPVGLAIVLAIERPDADARVAAEHRRFGRAMVLGLAYAATIGGFGTIIGSPANAAAAAIFEKVYGLRISFNLWAAYGMPLVLVGLPLAWLLLSRVIFPFRLPQLDSGAIRAAIGDPGRWTPTDGRLLAVLGMALAGWLALPLYAPLVPGVTDGHVSLLAALALFVLPAGGAAGARPLLAWSDTKQAPWQLLLLIGGGLALAEAINATDLSDWLQERFSGAAALPPLWQLAALAAATLFVTEFVTNTATVAAFLPASVALAGSGEIDPVTLGMVTALAANWGFVMPAGTPSLALAYGSGRLTVPQMAYAGLWMDAAGVFLILAVVLAVSGIAM